MQAIRSRDAAGAFGGVRGAGFLRNLILAAVAVAAAAPAAAESADPRVAVYRDGEIRASELAAWRRYRTPGAELPLSERDRRRLVEGLVVLRVEGARFAESALAGSAEYGAWRRLLEARSAAGALLADVRETSRPTEAELLAAYDADQDAYRTPARWRLQDLFRRFPDGAGEENRQRLRAEMDALHRRLLAGEDFSALARAESDSASRARGGRMGWVPLDRLRGPVREAVAELAPGEMTPVIETADGLTILRCERFVAAAGGSFAEARDEVERRLRRERSRSTVAALDAELRATARPTLRSQALATSSARAWPIEWREGDDHRSLEPLDVVVFLRDRGWADPGAVPEPVVDQLLEQRLMIELRAAEAARRGLLDDPAYRERLRFEDLELRAEMWARSEAQAALAAPTEQEVRKAFDVHAEAYRTPERIELRAIELAIDPQRPRELYDRARRLGEQLQAGEATFAEAIAALVPPGELRDLGSLTDRQAWRLGLNVELALADLEPGDASGLVQEGRKLYLLELVSRRASQALSFEEARPAIARDLVRRRSRAIRWQLRRELLAEQAIRLVAVEVR